MSKRSKPSKKATPPAGSEAKLSHNPFGNLAALGGQVPEGDVRAHEPEALAPEAPDESPILRFPKKLVVRMEKKGRRGKTVTRISGLPGAELKTIAGEMKKAMGCGAMVEGAELVLQGSLVDRAAQWLDKQGAARVIKG